MSGRKGTRYLIDSFIEGKLYKSSKLIIHSQVDFNNLDYKNLKKYNITFIIKTVAAPGLYNLGDVYVYPTTLEGIGLTIFEALSCGLPVILPNHPPMNEYINTESGKLIEVEKLWFRNDGYYWPCCTCNKKSLINAMRFYIDHIKLLSRFQKKAREFSIKNHDWRKRRLAINHAFLRSKIYKYNAQHKKIILSYKRRLLTKNIINLIFNNRIGEFLQKKMSYKIVFNGFENL